MIESIAPTSPETDVSSWGPHVISGSIQPERKKLEEAGLPLMTYVYYSEKQNQKRRGGVGTGGWMEQGRRERGREQEQSLL